jgi:hypothetical protein
MSLFIEAAGAWTHIIRIVGRFPETPPADGRWRSSVEFSIFANRLHPSPKTAVIVLGGHVIDDNDV